MAGKGRTSVFIALLKPLRAVRGDIYVRHRTETFNILGPKDKILGRFEATVNFLGPGRWGYTYHASWGKQFKNISRKGFASQREAYKAMREQAPFYCGEYTRAVRNDQTGVKPIRWNEERGG